MIVEKKRRQKRSFDLSCPLCQISFSFKCVNKVHRGCLSLPRPRSRPSASTETRQRRSAGGRSERSEERKDNERTRRSLILYLFSHPSSISLRAFYTHSSTVMYRTVERFYPLFPNYLSRDLSLSFLPSLSLFSSFIFTRIRFVSFILSLSYAHTHSSQLRFLALLELFAAGLTVVVGLALQRGLLGLRVLTLLLLLLLRCRIRRSRDGHLDRPSEIVYARR